MRFAADENFNNDILRGLLRRYPELDVVRIQDTEVYEAEDPVVLEWAAQAGRILLTHDDTRTMPDFAYERVREGKPLPGVFVVNDQAPMGQVIDDLLTILGASDTSEWENRVIYLPF
jgi:predicted nuclease of predicted toxin-antitoxin system